jgi:hypothetical protein
MFPWRRDNAALGPEGAAFARAADHAVAQAREQGCCCCPEVTAVGWMPGPDGRPAPVLTIAHDEWCPLLRSQDKGSSGPSMRQVRIEPEART